MKTTSLLLLMLITTSVLFSQENTKFRNNIGYGYFDSKFEPASKGGQYLYGEFGYNLKKDFWLNLRLLQISSKGNFEKNHIFVSTTTNYASTMVIPNISKDLKLGKKFVFGGTLGGALIFERVYTPLLVAGTNVESYEFANQGEEFNFGLFGEIYVKYKVLDKLFIGANATSYLPLHLELDDYMVGMSIELRY